MNKLILFVFLVLFGCKNTIPIRDNAMQNAATISHLTTDDQNSQLLQDISPRHEMIRYMGRVDFSNEIGPAFSHPGVNLRVRFTGTSLRVRLDDNALRQSVDTINYFNVVVDESAPVRLKTTPGQQEYILAEKLLPGTHEVVLFKRTESSHADDLNVGKISVRGFRIDAGARLLEPSSRKLKMEFIGDSITCGYGNELSVHNPVDDHFTTHNSNAYLAYGAVAARKLNAEYVAVAYSGRGVVRNYAGHVSPTIPEIYLKTLPDDPNTTVWNPEDYVPDIVVINLGTNDFSEGLTPGAAVDALTQNYAAGYEAFLAKLVSYYPDAQFILVVGPMLSDDYPEGYNALSRVRQVLQSLIKKKKESGSNNIHLLELATQQPPFGEDFHPTAATHERMAKELVDFISRL
ncbi:MAG: hypothetical protein JXR76_01355 [Deltaproteobacteria bacterium]|nr:hypothetical protein [Deltaproteobacteria bacterium]